MNAASSSPLLSPLLLLYLDEFAPIDVTLDDHDDDVSLAADDDAFFFAATEEAELEEIDESFWEKVEVYDDDDDEFVWLVEERVADALVDAAIGL